MPRRLNFIAACLLALFFCASGNAQDTPSLGDLARQAQKDKANANAPAKKVLTNDDLPSRSSTGAGLGSSGLGAIGAPAADGKPGAAPSPEQAVGQMEALISQIDSLDRATLVKNALQGLDSDFPGRSNWEQRLFSAKQIYVARGRDLLQKAKQIQATAETLKGVQDPNDPRVKDLTNRLQGLVRDGTQMDATFQAVILEGRDLAGQTSGHQP
jgi:hypothetical protein